MVPLGFVAFSTFFMSDMVSFKNHVDIPFIVIDLYCFDFADMSCCDFDD